MYESRSAPLVSRREFAWRMVLHIVWATVFIAASVLIGVLGHLMLEEGVHVYDAVLNSALIVGGIGPYIMPQTYGGKVFFAIYGVYVSLVFVATLGVVLAPIAHRVLHAFHLDDEN
ncbi:two pore domain potassium channel family protein [Achromobacter sp. F4_2707]|uniref:two pore domain potassium channel family protein n=1 Tax=Achromobacter sp. F4_2707 TaxID=3114286 RepID=UPI0039C6DD5B